MLIKHIAFSRHKLPSLRQARSITQRAWQPLQIVQEPPVDRFRNDYFLRSVPGHFRLENVKSRLPAMEKWFSMSKSIGSPLSLDHEYLSNFGRSIANLELVSEDATTFQRAEATLDLFLNFCKIASNQAGSQDSRFYLAQTPLSRLPQALQDDLPAPELVLKAGDGEIYDANIWMGMPPTYTPLHRDPNPNLFIQLAGTKIARIMPPGLGDEVFARVQRDLKGGRSKSIRGDEMMVGRERKMLEEEIWASSELPIPANNSTETHYEVTVEAGTAFFIPQGWWHSIKGVGSGITASVNWWFR